MLEVKLSARLAAPAEQVWDMVGNFNGMPAWHPFVKNSVLEPADGATAHDARERVRSFYEAARLDLIRMFGEAS